VITAFLILAAFTPVFLWLKYLQERVGVITPPSHVAIAFLAGVLISLPALLIESFLDRSPHVSFAWLNGLSLVELVTFNGQYGYLFVRAYVLGGFVEEGLKLLTILIILWTFRTSVRPASLIVIAVAVGGAFAAVENVLVTAGAVHWGRIAVLRALVSVPNHVFLGVFMGAIMLLAWKWRWRYAMACLAFAVPALMHGTSNYLLFLGAPEVGAPGLLEATARQLYGFLFLFQAVVAILILSRVSRWEAVGGGIPARPPSRARRRAFWAPVALIVGVFGLINLLIIIGGQEGSIFALNLGSTFVIGALSLMHALVIWGHAHEGTRRPAVQRT
jgi:RsiW-degrading membrane proteinase PrsW (M82 family)